MVTAEEQEIVRKGITESFDEMIQVLSSFDPTNLNQVPFEGSWTAGQVVDHILKGAKRLPDEMTKQADRRYDLYAEPLEKAFLNFDEKMKGPAFLEPGEGPFDKEALIDQLQDAKVSHLEAIENKDLTQICLDFEMPTIGFLTRYELLRFYAAHVKRHSHQLKGILKAVA